MEAIKNGERNNKKSNYVSWVSGSGWLQQANSVQDNLGSVGREQNDKNVGVLQGQSRRNTSRALWNVIDNLLGRQGEVVSEQKTARSLKHSVIFGDSPAAAEEAAPAVNNTAPDVQMFNLTNYMSITPEETKNVFSDKVELKPYSRGMG